jgi:hypothetical protein
MAIMHSGQAVATYTYADSRMRENLPSGRRVDQSIGGYRKSRGMTTGLCHLFGKSNPFKYCVCLQERFAPKETDIEQASVVKCCQTANDCSFADFPRHSPRKLFSRVAIGTTQIAGVIDQQS